MNKNHAILCALLTAAMPAAAFAKDSTVEPAPAALAKPAAGKGQVVFFRPSAKGFAIKCTVRENGAMVGRVGAGKYYAIEVEPGLHNFTAKSEKTDSVAIQVEPDETSFVKCGISMGIMVGRPNLSPASDADFAKSSAKMKPMDSAKIAEEISEDRARGGKSDEAATGAAN